MCLLRLLSVEVPRCCLMSSREAQHENRTQEAFGDSTAKCVPVDTYIVLIKVALNNSCKSMSQIFCIFSFIKYVALCIRNALQVIKKCNNIPRILLELLLNHLINRSNIIA